MCRSRVGSGAALLGLALAAAEGGPAWLLVALATLGGLMVPPLIASARVVWPQVVVPEQLRAAYGVQALLGDLGAVVGPAFAGAVVAAEDGAAASAALPLAVFAGASAVASLVYGTRPAPAGRRYLLGSVALVAACLPLAALSGIWSLAAMLVFAGAAFAAVNVAVFALLDEVAPEGTGAEALTWLTTAGAGGMALGAAVAGALAGGGSVAGALALPAVGAFLAAVVVVARRGTLTSAG